MSLGWTWDYVENTVTAPRLKALNAYFKDHPPMHMLLAAHVGFKPKERGTMQDLLAMMPNGTIKTGGAT